VPFFKLLSDNPDDYESEDGPMPEPQNDPEFEIESTASEHYLELLLDTGELLSIPLEWLIGAARYYNFHEGKDSCGNIH